jgi:hypothetical protein
MFQMNQSYLRRSQDLTKWRDKVLSGAGSAQKTKEADEVLEVEKKTLLSMMGEIIMANEIGIQKAPSRALSGFRILPRGVRFFPDRPKKGGYKTIAYVEIVNPGASYEVVFTQTT